MKGCNGGRISEGTVTGTHTPLMVFLYREPPFHKGSSQTSILTATRARARAPPALVPAGAGAHDRSGRPLADEHDHLAVHAAQVGNRSRR